MKVSIAPGETLTVAFEDEHGLEIDGSFSIAFGADELTVSADLPDASGREGIIYRETWEDPADDVVRADHQEDEGEG